MSEIRAIISDLDGTLVDTFEANFLAYQKVFGARGVTLTRKMYREAFGLRISELMKRLDIALDVEEIKRAKAECYPEFFEYLKSNRILIQFLRTFHQQGGKTALASTASRANVERVLQHIDATDIFDICITGEEVRHGKPDPECYLLTADRLKLLTDQILVFEDSSVGISAAKNAGMPVFQIERNFFYAENS